MNRLEHRYGKNFSCLNSHYLSGLLARLCSPETIQPEINRLVIKLYQHLLAEVINSEFLAIDFSQSSRMAKYHPEINILGKKIDPAQRTIVVNIARAGTYPSHVCFDALHDVLDPKSVRQDHIFASRTVDSGNSVTGTALGGSKIGGDQEGAIVIIPDPMGATGNTLVTTIDHYKKLIPGKARKYIAVHLIVTPEYLRRITTAHPDLIVYSLRVDRGLSSDKVLQSIPGTFWNEEKGLNKNDYIVPGGGGFGEIMNNSEV